MTLSSAEAELCAAVKTGTEAMGLQSILEDIGLRTTICLSMDASAAIAMLNRDGLGKARHIGTQFMWMQECIRDGRIKLTKVGTNKNPADLFTKPLAEEAVVAHMKAMGYECR